MGIYCRAFIFSILWLHVLLAFCSAGSTTLDEGEECLVGGPQEVRAESGEWPEAEEDMDMIADPLEPINRVFFHFNDKLYFWVLKPVSTGYKEVVPEPLRVNVRNFFSNLCMPVRAVNCLLQGKIDEFGMEIGRFLVNSTIGVLGFGDPAKKIFNTGAQDEDFGQTLGFFGFGPGIYINWPILGPSSLRDTVGLAGDFFLDPLNYVIKDIRYETAVNLSARSYDRVNRASLRLGEYESMKKAAIDPYVSLRDAYYQYRKNKIRE